MIEGDDIIRRLKVLYDQMDRAYREAATQGSFSCVGCDGIKCCTVDLIIHTYAEMVYLHQGFSTLSAVIQGHMRDRAGMVVASKDRDPFGKDYRNAVCVANFDGQCALYGNRPMICRLAGIPYTARRSDSKTIEGPGCERFQEDIALAHPDLLLDRSPFYRGMAEIEMDAVQSRRSRTAARTFAEVIHGLAHSL